LHGGDETALYVAHNINIIRNEISCQDSTEKEGMYTRVNKNPSA